MCLSLPSPSRSLWTGGRLFRVSEETVNDLTDLIPNDMVAIDYNGTLYEAKVLETISNVHGNFVEVEYAGNVKPHWFKTETLELNSQRIHLLSATLSPLEEMEETLSLDLNKEASPSLRRRKDALADYEEYMGTREMRASDEVIDAHCPLYNARRNTQEISYSLEDELMSSTVSRTSTGSDEEFILMTDDETDCAPDEESTSGTYTTHTITSTLD